MNYGYNKSVLETAGYSSLEPNSYINRSPQRGSSNALPQNEQAGKDERVSFARNFKMRLFNGDPQEQRSREALKDNYKRQLEQQMAENKRRKEEEKRKIQEEEMKHERAFYQNQKQNQQPTKDDRAQYLQKKRASSEKSITSPDKGYANKQTQKHFNVVSEMLAKDLYQGLPSLLQQTRLQKQERQVEQPFKHLLQYSYQDQRMASIKQFQQSIIRKMQGIRQQIQRTEKKLETKNQFDKIKGLLHKPIVPFDASNNESIKFYDVGRMQRRVVEVPPFRPIQSSTIDLNGSGQYQRLDGRTQVRYPEQIRAESAQASLTMKQGRPKKSESSQAEDQQYDRVQVPDLPSKFKKSNFDPMASFPSKSATFTKDTSLDRAKFIPKTDIVDYKIDNMLSNIDNLIAHYDKD